MVVRIGECTPGAILYIITLPSRYIPFSMSHKFLVIGVAQVLVLVGIFFALQVYFNQDTLVTTPNESGVPLDMAMEQYEMTDVGLTFSYTRGADAFTLVELPPDDAVPAPVRTVRLVPTADYLAEQDREGGEGSPAWVVRVFNNDQQLNPTQWVAAFPQIANSALANTTPVPMVISGAEAVTYRTDGLYPTEVFVMTNADFVYVVEVSFLDETSLTYTQYLPWIQSFIFTAHQAPTSLKADPQVVCEGALVYMTFPSSVEAEAFVAACVNGDHPEVFTRYQESMGGGDIAI